MNEEELKNKTIFLDGVEFKQPQEEIKIKIEVDKKNGKIIKYKNLIPKNITYNKNGITFIKRNNNYKFIISNNLIPSNLTEEERVKFIKNEFFKISRKLEKKYIYEAKFFKQKNKLNNNKEKNGK